jgi:predicted acyltransferase
VDAAARCALIAADLIWNLWLPINKKLWTSSFALFMAGIDFVLFAAFAWAVDVRGWQRPVRPFVILGMNAIAVYMVSELLETQLRVMRCATRSICRVFAPLASPINASLMYALAYTLLMFVVAWVLYRRQWFLKV